MLVVVDGVETFERGRGRRIVGIVSSSIGDAEWTIEASDLCAGGLTTPVCLYDAVG